MGKLNEDAKLLIGEIRPALVATSSKDGRPNVSAKGSLRVQDDDTLLFTNVNSPRTEANLKENPQVSVICLNSTTRQSCRIWGTAEVLNSGALFDEAVNSMAARNIKPKSVIKIKVNEVEVSKP